MKPFFFSLVVVLFSPSLSAQKLIVANPFEIMEPPPPAGNGQRQVLQVGVRSSTDRFHFAVKDTRAGNANYMQDYTNPYVDSSEGIPNLVKISFDLLHNPGKDNPKELILEIRATSLDTILKQTVTIKIYRYGEPISPSCTPCFIPKHLMSHQRQPIR